MTLDKSSKSLAHAKEAIDLFHDIYRGRSRSLVRFVSKIFESYKGTEYAKPEDQIAQLLMDLARVVSSQVSSPEARERKISTCERLQEAFELSSTLADITKRLSRTDHAQLRDMNDFVLRLGILQFDRVTSELGVYPHMYDSGILLEDSPGLARAGSTPGIRNKAVPANIQGFYDAYSELNESYQDKYMRSQEGPGL